jgi:hypothetical protein
MYDTDRSRVALMVCVPKTQTAQTRNKILMGTGTRISKTDTFSRSSEGHPPSLRQLAIADTLLIMAVLGECCQ